MHGHDASLDFLANEPTGVIAVIRVPLRPAVAAASPAEAPA